MITLSGSIRHRAERFWRHALDLLFPLRCVNCRRHGYSLCADCLHEFRYVPLPVCQRCGRPLRLATQACSACRLHPITITRIRSAVFHEGAARKAIHALKYNRRRDVAAALARVMEGLAREMLNEYHFVTAVPLHVTRQKERGYNQAELLAVELATLIRRPYVKCLIRTRATADQIGLDANARRDNVKDAFAVTGNLIAGKSVLLIDDVCTTGATLDACARTLLAAGARSVYGLTVARPRDTWLSIA